MTYPNLDVLVKALLAQGRKVEAVKQVRQATLWGLKESKDYVDAMAQREGFATGASGPVDYTAFSDVALLAALEYAGRAPHPSLIRECLARRESLTPGLLALLGGGGDMDWPEDEPRWYREIHAGYLLCAFREPAALPIFARVLREDDGDALLEWFESSLPHYGPPAIPMFSDMLDIQDDDEVFSGAACEMLVSVALHHPEARERVIRILSAHLPGLNESGNLVLLAGQRDEPPLLWTWIASAFMRLRHEKEHARIKALFDAGLLDEFIFGGWNEYRAAFSPTMPPPWEAEYVYDVVKEYEQLYEQAQEESRPAMDALLNPPPIVERVERRLAFAGHVAPKVGRNDPCPCGSGKKYKHCCGKKA